ncbi:hypothetical protein [Azospirillum argentinense]
MRACREPDRRFVRKPFKRENKSKIDKIFRNRLFSMQILPGGGLARQKLPGRKA